MLHSVWQTPAFDEETNMAIARQTMCTFCAVYVCVVYMCKKIVPSIYYETVFFIYALTRELQLSRLLCGSNGLWMNEKLHNFHKMNMTSLLLLLLLVYECLTLCAHCFLFALVWPCLVYFFFCFSSLLYCMWCLWRANQPRIELPVSQLTHKCKHNRMA